MSLCFFAIKKEKTLKNLKRTSQIKSSVFLAAAGKIIKESETLKVLKVLIDIGEYQEEVKRGLNTGTRVIIEEKQASDVRKKKEKKIKTIVNDATNQLS